MQVERVDFVSFLTEDIPRAKRFYSETLGLEIETEGEHDLEFRAGQVTLDVFDPSSIGQPFSCCTGAMRRSLTGGGPERPMISAATRSLIGVRHRDRDRSRIWSTTPVSDIG